VRSPHLTSLGEVFGEVVVRSEVRFYLSAKRQRICFAAKTHMSAAAAVAVPYRPVPDPDRYLKKRDGSNVRLCVCLTPLVSLSCVVEPHCYSYPVAFFCH